MDAVPFEAGKLAISSLLLLALAGCSGATSSTSTAEGSVERPAPTEPPPAEDPPPAEEPGDEDPQQPPAEPTVAFNAAAQTVPAGQTTTLTWSSSDADSCQASGGWSGSRAVQGSATVGPIDASTTFTLTCSGAGGSSVAMLSVSIIGVVNLAWEPPSENQDGSPLVDLSGYRIHYGSFSGNYSDEVVVNDGDTTQWELSLPSGEYYFAMTAFDAEGNESAYSNEVVRSIN